MQSDHGAHGMPVTADELKELRSHNTTQGPGTKTVGNRTVRQGGENGGAPDQQPSNPHHASSVCAFQHFEGDEYTQLQRSLPHNL